MENNGKHSVIETFIDWKSQSVTVKIDGKFVGGSGVTTEAIPGMDGGPGGTGVTSRRKTPGVTRCVAEGPE